jgi:ring-1,2-phenylacetyl-CoA epoxidase subunit PaaB
MPDTQWPRYMVFQQAKPDGAIVHNGTVHAADIEMALLNARDVFARRPEAAALWVAPVEEVYSRTHEENTANPPAGDEGTLTFYVFGKLSEQSQAELLGEAKGGSVEGALARAIKEHDDKNVLRWWLVPTEAVVKSATEDTEPMFTPGREKTFKDQAEYPVVTLMRQLRSKGKLDS